MTSQATTQDQLLRPAEVSEYAEIEVGTLRVLRALGVGPAPVRFGGKTYYQQCEIDEWISNSSATSTDAVRAGMMLQSVFADVQQAVASHR